MVIFLFYLKKKVWSMKILNVVNVTFLFPSVLPTKQLLAIIIKVMKLRTDAVRLPCKISKEVMPKKEK